MTLIEIRHVSPGDGARGRYDSLHDADAIHLRDSFYLWLLDRLAPRAGASLLDVACGRGQLVSFAAARGCRAVGVDFAREALRGRARAGPGGRLAVADGERLPVRTASFEHVTSIGSLEHYDDPAAGAAELARVLAPGGRALILLPNAFGLFGNIRHVLAHGDVFDDGQPIQRYGTRGAWQGLLAGAGLEVLQVWRYTEVERPRTWRDLAALVRRPARVLRGLVSLLVPVNLSNHLVFLCRRADP